jgi:hypothetical protein
MKRKDIGRGRNKELAIAQAQAMHVTFERARVDRFREVLNAVAVQDQKASFPRLNAATLQYENQAAEFG